MGPTRMGFCARTAAMTQIGRDSPALTVASGWRLPVRTFCCHAGRNVLDEEAGRAWRAAAPSHLIRHIEAGPGLSAAVSGNHAILAAARSVYSRRLSRSRPQNYVVLRLIFPRFGGHLC